MAVNRAEICFKKETNPVIYCRAHTPGTLPRVGLRLQINGQSIICIGWDILLAVLNFGQSILGKIY